MKFPINRFNSLSSLQLVKILVLLILFFFQTSCGKRPPLEEENDPLLQLFILNFADNYYSNSCQHPSFTLKKTENKQMELTLDDKKWFRFSPEGTAANPNSNNPTPVHFFFIQKEADTEISWVTSTTCITSPSYTYERTPISATQTEIKYNLWNSDFYFSNRTTSTYQNGYYIKLISGNPKITIRFE